MNIKKNTILIIAGFLWGLSGYTLEITSGAETTIQLFLMLFFVLIPTFIILGILKIKIKEKYYITISLFIIYFIAYSLSNLINGISFSILRELLLIYIVFVLCVLISKERIFFDFIFGLFIAMSSLVIFYFSNIDYSLIFSPLYRLETGQGANAIGAIAVGTFTTAYYYFVSKENKVKIFLFVMIITSLIVIIATRSRTSIVMLITSFFFINYFYKNYKIIITSLIIGFLIIIWQFNILEIILRIHTPEGYIGDKSLVNLTGRTELWKHGLQVIKNNFFFGVGPDKAYIISDGHKTFYHNAFMQSFVEVGILGFLPIVLILFISIINFLSIKQMFLIKTYFIIGLIGSLAEDHMFNFGTPSNLLYFLSILYLSKISLIKKDKKSKQF